MALTLRTVGGLRTPEIARAFLQSEPTIAQRLVLSEATVKTHVARNLAKLGPGIAYRPSS